MARSLRFPLWHWILFGVTLTAAVFSMGAVVALLLFYRSRTGEAQRLRGSGVEVASPNLPVGRIASSANCSTSLRMVGCLNIKSDVKAFIRAIG